MDGQTIAEDFLNNFTRNRIEKNRARAQRFPCTYGEAAKKMANR